MVQKFWLLEAAAFVLVTGAAFWRGRPVERWVAAIYVLGAALSPFVENLKAKHGVNFPLLAVDAAVALGFAIVAIRYAHWWAIVAAGAALFELLIHLAMLGHTGIPIHAYYVAQEISSDLMMATIALGVVLAFIARRERAAIQRGR